jgi:hypothetical protein
VAFILTRPISPPIFAKGKEITKYFEQEVFMPAPQAALLYMTATNKFRSFNIQLPAILARMNISDGSLSTRKSSASLDLFRTASQSTQDINRQRQMNDLYTKLFQGLTTGIAAGWQSFHSTATLSNVMINGPTASGGKIVCPCFEPTINLQSFGAGTGPQETKIRAQVAKAFWNSWQQMMDLVSVPGLPWYPMFAFLPMPVAPPTPNVPTPFIALSQVDVPMTAPVLKNTFSNSLRGCMEYHEQFSEALATSISSCFQIWRAQTQVTNVLGTGPVPTFAPPYVPGGPVVGGTGSMTPGGFL